MSVTKLHLAERKPSPLATACADIASDLGEICGYAVVAWDHSGEMRSAIMAGQGPIGVGLVPTLAQDALNRHIAAEMAPPTPISD